MRTFVFVNEDESNSTQPSKRVQTDDDKRKKQQLRQELEEKGGACLRCSQERKACDREDICSKCRLPRPGATRTGEATLCLRGIDKLWLWRAVEQHSLHGGSREQALHEARNTTFADSRQRLRELQALLGNNMSLVVYLTSKLGNSTEPSRIVAVSGSLAENLQSSPNKLTKQVKDALATHLPDLALRSPPNVSTPGQKLMASAQSALRVYRFFSNAAHIKYHVSPSDMKSASQVGCFLMEYCARLLATEVEEVLKQIRAMIWPRNPGDVPKHAFGLYYCILEGLQRWSAQNALDDVLNPLMSRASAVIPDLSLLYRNIYGSRETLREFVDREIPPMTDVHNLHLSHELLSTIHNPAKSWEPMPDPFHKDCLVHDFLKPGQVSWIPELHPVQSRVFNAQPILAAHTSPLQRGRSEAGGLISSEPLYESPDATLRNSSWDDRSTCIQSPTEAEHGAELRHGTNVQVGDVKSPQDLLGITGETGTHHKRGRSLASPQCTSPSPPFKQSKLDAGQTCLSVPEHQADDADITTEADETFGPEPWNPLWDCFFDVANYLA